VIIILPLPPSVNALYGNRKNGRGPGRYKTYAYRDWIRRADAYLIGQKWALVRFTGPAEVRVRLPSNTRGDVDNRLKAILDYLVRCNLTDDDRHNWRVSIERTLDDVDCEVEILPYVGGS
jgi:Holliday junction resolvase RusA-like endonuclease